MDSTILMCAYIELLSGNAFCRGARNNKESCVFDMPLVDVVY